MEIKRIKEVRNYEKNERMEKRKIDYRRNIRKYRLNGEGNRWINERNKEFNGGRWGWRIIRGRK